MDKAELHIDLGEFRLPVSAQVFITETFDNLEISVHARYHQHLFEQLRRLGQGIEAPGIYPAGNKIVPGTFRSRAGKNRGLDFEKIVVAQICTHRLGRLVTHDKLVSHFRTSQVKIAVLQTQVI